MSIKIQEVKIILIKLKNLSLNPGLTISFLVKCLFWDLGLIYDIDIGDNEIVLKMTFTSPTCPMMEDILNQVEQSVKYVAGKMPVRVELVWDPPWNLNMMSDAARIELDLTDQGW